MTGLQATLRNLETGKEEKIPPLNGYRAEREVLHDGPTQAALRGARKDTASSVEVPMSGDHGSLEGKKKADKQVAHEYSNCNCFIS